MAAVKFTGLISGIKGVVNGSIFQSNPAGYVMRTRTNGTRVNSVSWQRSKAVMARVAGDWRRLSGSDQATFTTQAPNYPAYDKFGNAYIPTGFQLYMSLNTAIYSAGYPVISNAVVPIVLTLPTALVVTGTWASTLALSYTNLVNANEILMVYAGPVQSSGTSMRVSTMRRIAIYTRGDGDSNLPLAAPYAAVFSDHFGTGTVYFYVQVMNTDTGQLGILQPFVVTI